MLRKLVAAGAVAAAMGGVVLGAVPAQADNDQFMDHANQGTFQIIGVNTCRGINGAAAGGVDTILGNHTDSGPCALNPIQNK